MELSSVQLRRIAERHNLGSISAVVPLGGSVRNNLALRGDAGTWVLRVALPPVESVDLRRGRFFARVLHEHEPLTRVTAPWPYIVDETDGILGRPFALLPLLPGRVLHPGMDVRWDRVGAALGRAVASLHRVTFPVAGEWDPVVDDIVPAAVQPADFLPTYLHGDLGIGNLVGARHPDGFRFTGVFDLDGGSAGDPEIDLAIPLWWPLYWGNEVLASTFLRAYRVEHPARPGAAERLRAYVEASMSRNWDAGHRAGQDWYGGATSFREWSTPLIVRMARLIEDA